MQAAKRGHRRSSQRCKTKQLSSYPAAVPCEDQQQEPVLQLPENDAGKEPGVFHADIEHLSASLEPTASSSSCDSWSTDLNQDKKLSASSRSYGSLPTAGPEALSNTQSGFFSPEQVRFAQQQEDSLLATPVDISSAFVATSSKVSSSADLERSPVRTVDTLPAPSPKLCSTDGLWAAVELEVEASELGMADINRACSPASNEDNIADASSIRQPPAKRDFSLTSGSMSGVSASEPTVPAPQLESSSRYCSPSTNNTVAQFDIVSSIGLKRRKAGGLFSLVERRNCGRIARHRVGKQLSKVKGGVDDIACSASDVGHSEVVGSSFVHGESEGSVVKDGRTDEHVASDNLCPSEVGVSALHTLELAHVESQTANKERAEREPQLDNFDWEDTSDMDTNAHCASQMSAAARYTGYGLSSTVDEAVDAESLQSALSVLPPTRKLTVTASVEKKKADKARKRRRQSAFGAELNLDTLEIGTENTAISGSGCSIGEGLGVEKDRTEQEGGGIVNSSATSIDEKTSDLANSCQDPSKQLSTLAYSSALSQVSETAVPDTVVQTTVPDEVFDTTGLDEQQRAEAQDIFNSLRLDDEPEPLPKKKRKRRMSADLAILMENEQSELTQPKDNQEGQPELDDTFQTHCGRRSSLRLYRRQSHKFAVTSNDVDAEVPEQNSEQKLSSGTATTAEDGSVSVSSASHADANNEAERSDSAEAISTELENLYKNKNYKVPAGKVWETIFEVPCKGKMTSKQKLKRYVQFDNNVPIPKLRRRLKRAAENGWDADIRYSQTQFTDLDVKLKLQKLDEEIE